MVQEKMRLLIISVSLFLISFGRGLSQDTLKCWSSTDRLKWSDFKASVPFDEQQSSTKAICPYNISVKPGKENGILHYKVKLTFFKNKAWTKDTTKYLLAHEQLHFDIAEIFARKLRNAIQDVSASIKEPTGKDFKPVIELFLGENEKWQTDYDNETFHGLIGEEQQKWSKKIKAELEQLKGYASTTEDCK